MKRLPLIGVLLALGALLTPMLAQNKTVASRVGFVDADALVQAHPDYKKVQEVQSQARKELAPLEEKLKPLDEKVRAGQATAKERQDYEALAKTYQASRSGRTGRTRCSSPSSRTWTRPSPRWPRPRASPW